MNKLFKAFWTRFVMVMKDNRGFVGDPPADPPADPPPSDPPAPTRNEIMRELSKEYGFNLFDAEGVKAFKEFQASQKTDLEKAQEAIAAFEQQKAEWQTEKTSYDAKLKAIELGIPIDLVGDALKLADGDVTKLDEVIKKYPNFRTKDGIKIGVVDPKGDPPPSGKSEVEQYMADKYSHPKYKPYVKTKT